ncbi:DUF309 domain-containing protein [Pseudarthrobacter sp. AB1]|uniref:DUF309 domain-containing protein n=1 Tax=Pseudarthrobacter sp. AB1 TaxID=2138309 RepID=UPI00281696A3|nr:DUF309 domain-containing protein [Pseudarthrobacter sp. AB1]
MTLLDGRCRTEALAFEPVSEEPLPPAQTLVSARRLVEAGRPFAAHEVLEARWKAGPAEERNLWQGLAQICVGLTHAARGNSVGGLRLLERDAAGLEEYGSGDGPAYRLDLSAVVNCTRDRMRPLSRLRVSSSSPAQTGPV